MFFHMIVLGTMYHRSNKGTCRSWNHICLRAWYKLVLQEDINAQTFEHL